uniref:ShKT domain-containing protein n=1 Tax=Meloidogyne hapla TaxID=6305 RepID=A0A1I8BTT3_MELHA
MVAWMKSLAKQNPKFVQFISIGKSHEGRGIEGLEIGSRGFRKRAFWIDGGIHAREIRLWRKNRSPTHCVRDQWGRNRCCKGVDLNRNFDFHFKESGSSDDPCSEIYQGKHAFSEPEARDSYPGDVQDLFSVGQRAATALSSLYGTKYVVGSGADTLYPASGGSEDWAKESANIKYVYLLELRPDEKIAGVRQFILTDKTTNNTPIITETKNLKLSSVNELEIKKEKNELEEEQKNIKICFDRRRACRRWVKQSEHLCQSVSIFMTDQCARSCGFC